MNAWSGSSRKAGIVAAALAWGAGSFHAMAQCDFDWQPDFGMAGFDSAVEMLAVADLSDGNGPRLVAGGSFWSVDDTLAYSVARLDGSQWSPMGQLLNIPPGQSATTRAMAVFDGGAGPQLYVGGTYSSVAGPTPAVRRWNGASFTSAISGFPNSGTVHALAVFDEDGSGPLPAALYAGGKFTINGGPLIALAKFDGTTWSAVGGAITGGAATVNALSVFDDGLGGGPALVVGGDFLSVGGLAANHIAKWSVSGWSALGSGADGIVSALAAYQSALIAGGNFAHAGSHAASSVARWDGVNWSGLGSGISGTVTELLPMALNGQPTLIAGGTFTGAGASEAVNIARWNGTTWTSVGNGLNGSVNGLAYFDDHGGSGPALFIGGAFTSAGGEPTGRFAKLVGSTWLGHGGPVQGVGSPSHSGMGPPYEFPLASAVYDDGAGANLYIAGRFSVADGTQAKNIARFDGTSWHGLGSGVDLGPTAFDTYVQALAVFDSGAGPELYAGGSFTVAGGAAVSNIAKWDGRSWSDVGGGTNGSVRALIVYDDDGAGPHPSELCAGGSFTSAGGVPAVYLAKWNGREWSNIPAAALVTTSPPWGGVNALAVDATPSIPVLYLGGLFQTNGSNRTFGALLVDKGLLMSSNIGEVYAMQMVATPTPRLYVGGAISIGNIVGIARWTGAWFPLGTGTSGYVRSMTMIGNSLYVSGRFSSIGGVSASNVARWANNAWSALGDGIFAGSTDGLTPGVTTLCAWNPPGSLATELYAGGQIVFAGDHPAVHVARWAPVPPPTITEQPVDRTVQAGRDVGFAVAVAGAAPLSYQWRRNGEPLVNNGHVFGAASRLLVIHEVSADDSGVYDLVETSDCEWSVTSESAVLTVVSPCPDDVAPFEGDQLVDIDDLSAVIGAWGPCPGCPADIDDNGVVDIDDLFDVINGWGPCP